jgi:hypothetical protein
MRFSSSQFAGVVWFCVSTWLDVSRLVASSCAGVHSRVGADLRFVLKIKIGWFGVSRLTGSG